MERLTENKIILVRRKTRLAELIVRFNTIEQAKFYVEHLGADFSDYLKEHRQYEAAVNQSSVIISRIGRLQVVDRAFLPNFIFGKEDIVVVVGQDGLVANTLKYLSDQPVIGVNPDPLRWEGILLPFAVGDLEKITPEVLKDTRAIQEVSMAKAALNDGRVLYAVNDFFIGQKTHVSARYQINWNNRSEQQSSSGIIVSTGLGATGWLKSVLAGAAGITGSVLSKAVKIGLDENFHWDSDYLYYSVREPFPSKQSGAKLVFGKVTKKQPLIVLSQMPESGVIFSDGIESDFLEFRSGSQATITVAEKKGRMVI